MTLSPLPRRAIITAGHGGGGAAGAAGAGGTRGTGSHSSHTHGALRGGMAVLLHTASTGNATPFYGLADPEVRAGWGLADLTTTGVK